MLPEGFLDAYRRELGGEPPREFLEAYELLCEALYFGLGVKPESPGKVSGGDEPQYWFGDDSLLGVKASVDRRLASIRGAVRSWAATRSRTSSRRPGPEADGGGVLAGARGARDPGTVPDGQEA